MVAGVLRALGRVVCGVCARRMRLSSSESLCTGTVNEVCPRAEGVCKEYYVCYAGSARRPAAPSRPHPASSPWRQA
jgi:hypothetical protein